VQIHEKCWTCGYSWKDDVVPGTHTITTCGQCGEVIKRYYGLEDSKAYDVYLGGAMGGRLVSDVLAERAEAAMYCRSAGLTYYDPAEDEGLNFMEPTSLIPTNYNLAQMDQFVRKDDEAIDQARMFVNLTGDRVSDGTGWEMGRAYYQNRSKVILVAPQRYSLTLVGFSNIKAFYVARSIREAINQCFLLKKLGAHNAAC